MASEVTTPPIRLQPLSYLPGLRLYEPRFQHSMPSISSLLALEPFDPSHRFTTSWLLPPFILGGIRLLISIYMFATTITRLIWASINDSKSVGEHWSYFTNITYWAGSFYFLFAAYHTLAYSRSEIAPLQKWWKGAQAAHGVLWSTWVVFAFLV